jgi:DNA-3-methyladenine glycosylase
MPSRLQPLPRKFFERHPRIVARQLLGKVLVRRLPDGTLLSGRLVETEAYLGREGNDPAAHAYGGQTQRNAVLFGPPGHAYVYFTYGMHYCMNISCQPEGRAGCVLLRAVQPLEGVDIMAANRGMKLAADASPSRLRLIAAGPGRLCQALCIVRELDNGKDLTQIKSDLFVTDDGYKVPRVIVTPRVGITRAVDLPLRFAIAGNRFVSGKLLG